MKKSQRARIAAQALRICTALDHFDELGALHDELKDGSPEKATLFAACEKLDAALQMLNHLATTPTK